MGRHLTHLEIKSVTQHLGKKMHESAEERFRVIPTQCLLFSSCLLAERSDPGEDQELRWPQERSTLHQQSPDTKGKEREKFSQQFL